MKQISLLLLTTTLLSSCSYNESRKGNSASTPPAQSPTTKPETPPQGGSNTPDKPKITYKSVHEAVFKVSCVGCHSSAAGNIGGVNLESYEAVLKNVHAIRLEVAGTTMPPQGSSRLTEEQIKLVTEWIDNGASQN
jgi:mono/diheme cytochrome c family protein